MARIAALALAMLLVACTDTGGVNYPAVPANVSYETVLALPTGSPSRRIAYGEDPLQHGQLWLPRNGATDALPLVVFIHGGCWLNSFDMSHTYPFLTALAQSGFAVWSLEYRRSGDPGGGWPGTYQDILAGLAHIDRLEVDKLDLSRIAVMGHSAGGHLAVLAGTEFSRATTVIGIAAITDIEAYARGAGSCQRAATAFMGGAPDRAPDAWARANPARHTPHPGTYLLQGSEDQIVPPAQAKLAGATTLTAAGASHFDWIHPGAPAFAMLLELIRETLGR